MTQATVAKTDCAVNVDLPIRATLRRSREERWEVGLTRGAPSTPGRTGSVSRLAGVTQ